MSKATVVSLLPFEINERKIGLYPGHFTMAAYKEPLSTPLTKMRPSVLVIGDCHHFVDVGEDRPMIKVPNLSFNVAQSIVNDYVGCLLAVEDGIGPALFCLDDVVKSEEVAIKYPEELQSSKDKQIRWFKELCKIADTDFGRTHRHNTVSDLQRIAANLLGLTPEWMTIEASEPPKQCPVCLSSINSKAIVCPQCRAILDKEQYSQFEFAQI